MENISKDTLVQVENDIVALLSEVENAVEWSSKFLKGETKKNTIEKIKSIRRELKKIKYAIGKNPSSAMYGESQVGKSYLIKNLLSEEGQPFKISEYNFLEDINPKGDKTEATSVVTRFSTQVDIIDADYPIKVQLLAPKDIILIMCDTYFEDLNDHTSIPKSSDIEQHLKEIEALTVDSRHKQSFLTEDDVYEIKEYLESYFKSFTTNLMDSSFFEFVSESIDKIDFTKWTRVFEILWGKNRFISDTFSSLIDELHRLNFAPTVYTNFKAVLRKYGTLLHVARLRELDGPPTYEDSTEENFIPTADVICINNDQQSLITINKSHLCALVAELVFKVDEDLEQHKKFLKTSDLLDFPGARSRLENPENKIAKEHISRMVLRGKVSYIFNKYSNQYLISNLLFCNNNAQISANYIPRLLNNWIENFIGKTPMDRDEFLDNNEIPPLFIIFTFFNEDLKFNPINDKWIEGNNTLTEKWTKRFRTIFGGELISETYSWHTNWTSNQPTFQNNYMLRDFYYSHEIFKGYIENGNEFGVNENVPSGYLEALKESFINDYFVKNHFQNPEEAWRESATPNNDGSKPIIRNLTRIANNQARTKKFIRELNRHSTKVKDVLYKYYHSDESDERIRKANQQGGKVQLNMDIVFGKDSYAFSNFIKAFQIKESDVYNFFHEKISSLEIIDEKNLNEIVLIRQSNPNLDTTKSYEENCQVLMKTYQMNSISELEDYFSIKKLNLSEIFYGEANQIKKNSTLLSEALRDRWFESNLTTERFKNIIELGFDEASLENLFENIKTCFGHQNIDKVIAKNIRDYVDKFSRITEAEEMIADISASLINKFVSTMGWSFYSETEKDNLKQTNIANDLSLNFDFFEEVYQDLDSDEIISELIDNMGRYEEYLGSRNLNTDIINSFPYIHNLNKWKNYMRISFIANCDIPSYDIKANNELKILLEKLDSQEFSLIN